MSRGELRRQKTPVGVTRGCNHTSEVCDVVPIEAGVDYLEFTVDYANRGEVLDLIPGGVEVRRNQKGELIGWRGYTHSGEIAQGKGRVGWSPDDERMGFHVSLGSEGLSVLAALDDRWKDHAGVLQVILDRLGGHATRLDLCWDDFAGLLGMDDFEDALHAGRFVSRWRSWECRTSEKNGVRGRSAYMGSPQSDSMLRVYDKRAERLQKGFEVEVDHWLRVEVQFRRKRADAVAHLFKRVREAGAEVMTRLAGVLRGLVEFKEPSSDTNKQRQAPAGWWLRFLGGAEKAALAVVKAEARTLADVKAWIAQQVSPSLALLEKGLGFDQAWGFLYAEAQAGRSRWTARHRSVLAASGVPG